MLFTPRFSFDGQPRPDHADDSATDPGDQGLHARGIRGFGARLGAKPSAERRIPRACSPWSPGSVAESSAWSGRGWPSSESGGVNSTT